MIITIVVGIICVFLAFLARFREVKFGLEVCFAVIFLFLGLRYDFGSDYNTYLDAFKEINNSEVGNLFDPSFGFEPGWIILCRLFKPFGFFAMVMFLSAFSSFTFYYFIKKYIPKDYYWLGVFIYFFSPSLMLVHSSAMRQAIAIAIFMFSLESLYQKKALKYFAIVAIAWLFHTSAIILIPVYFLRIASYKLQVFLLLLICLSFLALIPFGGIMPIIGLFVNATSAKYEFYQTSGELSSGFGFLILFIQATIIIYFIRFQTKRDAVIFNVSLFGLIFVPLSLIIAMIVRLSMYFEPLLIVVYPLVSVKATNLIAKSCFVILIIAYTFYILIPFFKPDIWNFEVYHTIFSSPSWQ